MILHQTDDNGFFVQTFNADPNPREEGKWLVPYGAVEEAPPLLDKPGDRARWNGQAWEVVLAPPPEPEPVPPPDPIFPISTRQFYHGLWKWNIITLDEAKLAIKVGDLPPTLQALIDQMATFPAGMEKGDVELIVTGAGTFEREHPITELLGGAFQWTDEQLDVFWKFCGML